MIAWLFLGQVLGGHLGAHHEAAAAGLVGLGNAALAVEESAGGEVRPLHVLENFGQAGRWDSSPARWWR